MRESESALAFFGIRISNTGGPLGGYRIILLVYDPFEQEITF